MNREQFLVAALIAFVAASVAAAIFVIILRVDADAQRNDRLQQECIRHGGNWSYGCDIKPEKS